MINGKKVLSDFKFIQTYSKYNDFLQRKETWEESVMDRIRTMHMVHLGDKLQHPRLKQLFDYAFEGYLEKRVLGSQRVLQFGGEPILKHHSKLYNCLTTYIDRPKVFQDLMYFLLSGCGVGFSVQKQHINKLPKIKRRTDGVKTFVIQDSIEGWSDAVGVLLSSYFETDAPFPDYQNYRVDFDYSLIRPEGSFISGGFKAPGHKGLQSSIEKICELLDNQLIKSETNIIRPIVAYDIIMHLSDAVLSGGVRRSATICIFSKDDEEMLKAKTGDWYVKNPQRGRSNNSVALLKDEVTEQEFLDIIESIKQFGEPAFILLNSLKQVFNPCVEVDMTPYLEINTEELSKEFNVPIGTELSGFQGCNLSEINGAMCKTEDDFYIACKQASILGTIQASYTDFKYVDKVTKYIFEREALLGVSITGFMNNPEILLNPEILKRGAEIVKEVNKEVAELIGINQSARTTCVKPSGTASIILETASGIHGEHAPMYFRHVQINKFDDYGKYLKKQNPSMFEESVWSSNKTDDVIAFPIIAPSNSYFKNDLTGVKLLEHVKTVQQSWVEYGTNEHLCVDKTTRHNVSNTVNVKENEWNEVAKYIYENRKYFAGISLLSNSGDKDYNQAPFTQVFTTKQIIKEYGDGALFASGLIVDALKAFDNNLWSACDTVLGFGIKMSADDGEIESYIDNNDVELLWFELTKNEKLAKKLVKTGKPTVDDFRETYNDMFYTSEIFRYGEKIDWIRRAKKFSNKYFNGDIKKMTYCLKDVHNNHKWNSIVSTMKNVDWTQIDVKPQYVDVDSLGAISCSGGACEI